VGLLLVRLLVGTLGGLLLLGGIAIAAIPGPAGGGLIVALVLFVPGAILIAAMILERTRYRSLEADRRGDGSGPGGGEPGRADGRFRATGERFVDPTTGVPMRVFVDRQTGERRYVAEG
jgi:membrane protein implicated in regulation of membrane protease activity